MNTFPVTSIIETKKEMSKKIIKSKISLKFQTVKRSTGKIIIKTGDKRIADVHKYITKTKYFSVRKSQKTKGAQLGCGNS